MSPAAPSAPRWMRPATTIPQPIPVPTLMKSRWSTLAPVRPVLPEGHDVDVVVHEHRHPVAVGEALGDRIAVPAGHDRRVARPAGRVLDRARHSDPDSAHDVVVLGPPPAGRAWNRSSTQSRTVSGPPAIGMSALSSASTVPPRLVTASRECVAPRSAASATPASSLKASIIGGRPPVESLSPSSRSSPWSRSWSSRWAIVDRARPVSAERSARVAPSPSRISCSSVPAPNGCTTLVRSPVTGPVNQPCFCLSSSRKRANSQRI